jgi:hypothetical protein
MISPRRGVHQESRGTGTLVVVWDSTRVEALHVPEILLAALDHFGMPYRLHDVSRDPLDARDLMRQRAVVIGQEHVGEAFRPADVRALLSAVNEGLGLVSFDHDLGRYPMPYRDTLGLEPRGVRAVSEVTTGSTGHFVTWTRETGGRVGSAGRRHSVRCPGRAARCLSPATPQP